mgnify:CR=1 FL=1
MKHTNSAGALALASLIAATALPATAQTTGWYGGLNLGQSRAKIDDKRIADSLVVMMGSDFARGPGYNGDSEYDGKDHWSITSAMLMGKGIGRGRVVGGTTDDQRALAVDPGSLALKDGGKVLKPETIHLALRKLAGVADNELATQFPLAGDDLPKLLTG